LLSESGFQGGYQTVKRFVRKLGGNQPPQPRAVILTAPGEEAQVDYGQGAMVRDPQTGKYRRTRLFVMTLTCKAAVQAGIECIAFGDLFLTDIRAYREKQLENSGLQPIFPVWGMPTKELARSMIKACVPS